MGSRALERRRVVPRLDLGTAPPLELPPTGHRPVRTVARTLGLALLAAAAGALACALAWALSR